MKKLSWTAKNGQTVVVTVRERSYDIEINGRQANSAVSFSPVPAEVAARAAQDGIVCFIGRVGLTQERRDQLETLWREVCAEAEAKYAPLRPLWALEKALADAETAIQRHDENPGTAYYAREQALLALVAWKAENPEVWAREVTERRARNAELRRYQESAIGEGID